MAISTIFRGPSVWRAGLVVMALLLLAGLAGCHGGETESTPDAGSERVLGLTPMPDDEYAGIPLAPLPVMGQIPDAVDLSDRMPPPGDQGAQGSCAAWAAGYALKGYQENVERSWGVAGPAHRFSPAYIYNQIKRSGCDEGARLTDALDLLAQQGCATLEQMPYDDGDCAATPTPAVKAQAAEYRIAAYQRVDITDAEEMKSHLAAGLPVVVGVKVYASFLGLSGSAVYATASGPFKGLHAMAVVGYDDASASFKLMNSWSTGWGDGGYVRISYDLFPSLLKEAYVAEDLQAGKRNLTTATQGAGRVLLSPPGGVYAPGSVVEVRAAPDPGWAFDHWEGDAHGSTTPAHVTMDADRTVVAVFGEQLPTQAAAPGFSPPGGTTFLDSLDVTLSSPTSGATIRYTLDGSAPSPTKGTVYAGPVHLTASATIKALAYASGLSPSVVASASYTKKEGHFDVDGAAVALWYLNGNGADATGHGHDLAIKSDRVTWSSAGALTWAELGHDPWTGSCAGSDGAAMTAQGPTYPGSGDWTVEAWLRYPATSGQFIVVEQSDGLHPTDPDLGLVYRLAISDGDATFWMRLPGNNTIVDGVDVSAHAGQWFHAAVVYRGGAAMDFYVNGVLAGHDTIISSPIVSAPQGQVYLGGDRCGTSAGLALDEVRLSNVARY